jgi:hypothetical protein
MLTINYTGNNAIKFTIIMLTLEQRVAHLGAEQAAHLEAEVQRLNKLLKVNPISNVGQSHCDQAYLLFGAFANDPYFDEIIQRMREERELDSDNPAYT